MNGQTEDVSLSSEISSLIESSFEAMQNSYSPYSHFKVGAAVLCKDGTIFKGCNVENASYPVGVCAEKVAVTKAVSDGHQNFKAIAVASEMTDKCISPCGTCRQFLAEFGMDYNVYMLKADKTYIKQTVGQLLPFGFSPKDLQEHNKGFERQSNGFENMSTPYINAHS